MNEQQDGEGAETPHHDSGGGEPTPADPQATKLDMLIQSVANLQTKVSESVNTVQELNTSMMQLKEDFYGSGDEEEENPDYVTSKWKGKSTTGSVPFANFQITECDMY